MSVYSNVNYNKLKTEVTKAINELNNYDATSLIGNIKNAKTLSYDKSPNLKTKLNNAAKDICDSTIKDGSIKILKQKLTSLKTVAGYIEKIQNLESEIKTLEKKLYDKDGNVKINVQREISSKKQSIQNYENMI